jgi:hypothetical protein
MCDASSWRSTILRPRDHHPRRWRRARGTDDGTRCAGDRVLDRRASALTIPRVSACSGPQPSGTNEIILHAASQATNNLSIDLSDKQARFLRLRAQRLALPGSHAHAAVLPVVQELCGIQAQDLPAAALGIRSRSQGLGSADVDAARLHARTIVRTWGPRGTLHLLAAADLDWLLPLLGPIFIRQRARRFAELGLDEDTTARAITALREMLVQRGPATRAEIVEGWGARGLHLEGQAVPHLIGRAALEGFICLGPERGHKDTYVLLEDWLGRSPPSRIDIEVAAAEMARRYLAAYAPATPEDLAAWSGLPLRTARSAWEHIADDLIELRLAQRSAWMLRASAGWQAEPPRGHAVVHMLPAFDNYLLGYSSRDLILDPANGKRINAGGGLVRAALLVDGRILGTWQSQRTRAGISLAVQPFIDLWPEVWSGLTTEAADVGRFLAAPVALEVQPP